MSDDSRGNQIVLKGIYRAFLSIAMKHTRTDSRVSIAAWSRTAWLGALVLGIGCSSGTDGMVDDGGHAESGGGGGNPSGGNDTSSTASRGGSRSGTGGSHNSGGALTTSSKGGNGNPAGSNGEAGQGATARGGSKGTGGSKAAGGSGAGGAGNKNTSAGQGGAAGGSTQAPPDGTCSSVRSGDVTFSAPSGTFKGTLSVTLATSVSGAEIRYTTDGKDPTSSSALYSSALSLTKTTRVRAAAFVGGSVSGTPSAALYIARAVDAAHDLPVIVLDSYGSGKLPTAEAQRTFVDVAYLAYDLNNGSASLDATPTVASLAAFHVRGNSSAMFDKVPYRLELRDEAGQDRDCPVLGMPAESDWALVGPHADKTLVHNSFVYDLGREMGMQVPRVKLAEVYVNVDAQPLASDDYQGVYQIVETIKDQKNRLNLKQLDETKTSDALISGGYILAFEWSMTAENPLPCPSSGANCWKALELVDPNPTATEQKNWITQYLVSFNDALHSSNPADETNGYPKYIEPKTFVDQVIIQEFTRNMDAYARSQYFYKDRDAKLNAGPLWDYDLIAGVGMNAGSMMGGSMANTAIEGWEYEANSSRLKGATADWFPVLIANATFKAQLVARWKELRTTMISDSAIATRIDTISAGLANAADRNFKKWNILSQAQVRPFDTPTKSTWAEQISYMKTWLQQRAAWLDTQWK